MILVEFDPLNLANLLNWFLNFFFNFLDFVLGETLIEYVLQNNYFQSISFLFDVIIPCKFPLLVFFGLNLLHQCLLFHLSRLILFLFLIEFSSLYFYMESASDFTVIQVLNGNIYTLLTCKWNGSIPFRQTILILINFDLLFASIEIYA